jgi:hypothetical protein
MGVGFDSNRILQQDKFRVMNLEWNRPLMNSSSYHKELRESNINKDRRVICQKLRQLVLEDIR